MGEEGEGEKVKNNNKKRKMKRKQKGENLYLKQILKSKPVCMY